MDRSAFGGMSKPKLSWQYIQSVAGGTSTADQITRLADLKANGTLSEAEFQAGKAKALAT